MAFGSGPLNSRSFSDIHFLAFFTELSHGIVKIFSEKCFNFTNLSIYILAIQPIRPVYRYIT